MSSTFVRRLLGLAGWTFFGTRPQRPSLASLRLELAIVISVAAATALWQHLGGYELLEWADLDRLQQTTLTTGPTGVALVLINDQDYEEIFHSTSPLTPEGVVQLVDAVCAFEPGVVGVDLLSSDWPAGWYENDAGHTSAECKKVWITDVVGEVNRPSSSDVAPITLKLGKVLGSPRPPDDVCAAVAVLTPDGDGVVRRYGTAYQTLTFDADVENEAPIVLPTLVSVLASYAVEPDCEMRGERLGDVGTARKIRFTFDRYFTRLTAKNVLESAQDPSGPVAMLLHSLLEGQIVIIGGAYRHGRDEFRTPVGTMFGAEVIANAVATEITGPIKRVPWWTSLIVDALIGSLLLLALTSTGLRWPWKIAATLILSATAALVISWVLFDYLGYFFGVLAGLAGVMLAIVVDIAYGPLLNMWELWWGEFKKRASGLYDAG